MLRSIVACVFLVGCSTTTIVQVVAEDAGQNTPPGADDAGSPPVEEPDTGTDAPSPVPVDAASEPDVVEASTPCPSYQSPQGDASDVIYLLSTECSTSCGAPGVYRYETFANGQPSTAGSCKRVGNTTEYCCAELVCGRRPNLDQFCALYNPGYGKGYNCDAPQGQALPTRANCQHYAHPQAGPAEWCCAN
jgi:hypothetical protein